MSTLNDELLSSVATLPDVSTTEQVASFTGFKVNTFEIWRLKGKGPKFIKLGNSKQSPVRYLRADVEAWLAGRKFASTSEYPNKAA
jgi:predicted DNA-binding transcriptional regulator AlpA